MWHRGTVAPRSSVLFLRPPDLLIHLQGESFEITWKLAFWLSWSQGPNLSANLSVLHRPVESRTHSGQPASSKAALVTLDMRSLARLAGMIFAIEGLHPTPWQSLNGSNCGTHRASIERERDMPDSR